MDNRELRGSEIAALSKVVKKSGQWLVPSQSGKGSYTVDIDGQHCTCPAEFNGRPLFPWDDRLVVVVAIDCPLHGVGNYYIEERLD